MNKTTVSKGFQTPVTSCRRCRGPNAPSELFRFGVCFVGVLLVVIGVGLFLEWYRKRFGPLVLSTVLRRLWRSPGQPQSSQNRGCAPVEFTSQDVERMLHTYESSSGAAKGIEKEQLAHRLNRLVAKEKLLKDSIAAMHRPAPPEKSKSTVVEPVLEV
ncbi:uncharacterized protein LOC134856701 [Symsagittifera roscoffensis]|uniref:uncharacterized protein LOC134856701 n=1 Tax=Symsagittifera roscoffensis TaxID=84072 RepID=UPI00307BA87C